MFGYSDQRSCYLISKVARILHRKRERSVRPCLVETPDLVINGLDSVARRHLPAHRLAVYHVRYRLHDDNITLVTSSASYIPSMSKI
jgi:hypothetical protein